VPRRQQRGHHERHHRHPLDLHRRGQPTLDQALILQKFPVAPPPWTPSVIEGGVSRRRGRARRGDVPIATIAELAGVSPPTVSKVLDGVRAALVHAGIAPDADLERRGVFTVDAGLRLGSDLLDLRQRPTASRRHEIDTHLVVRGSAAAPVA
jgi:hypothetical protein